MASLARRPSSAAGDIWPGFVDALATLLMVIIFLLTVFVLAQFFLSELLAGRDQALKRLESNIAELTEVLGLERRANIELRATVAGLSSQLQQSTADRDRLTLRLSELQSTAADAQAEARRLKGELEAALKEVTAGKETVRLRLLEIASLKADIDSLRKVRAELEKKVGTLAASLKQAETEAGALRDRSKKLAAELADERERTQLSQKELKARETRIEELTQAELDARKRAALLNNQIANLRQELAKLAAALDASEKKAKEQNIQIANLGSRLNAALAGKVQELARYRSEFFGRLREILGSRSDVRVVGDRFVFQSEVLFASGDSALNAAGQAQLSRLAAALKEISAKIPADLNWILRVDGHTDIRPIATEHFPSNWELSTARALSVVRYLIGQGIEPRRLAATGF
ncbi:MAG: OmpA family protein, partial [Alphaproteobacteria bacterium]|nr:OmpA family protein [Alphaproteobacteria bacterium]